MSSISGGKKLPLDRTGRCSFSVVIVVDVIVDDDDDGGNDDGGNDDDVNDDETPITGPCVPVVHMVIDLLGMPKAEKVCRLQGPPPVARYS